MKTLNKAQMLRFIDESVAVLDAPGNPVNPFASSVWLRNFVSEVATESWDILVPDADAGDSHVKSLMLLYRDAPSSSRLAALSNYYASLYSPMASTARTASDRKGAMASLVRDLSDCRPRLDVVNFSPLDAESADTDALASALAERGWFARRYYCFGNWTLPCEDLSFEQYLATRDSQLKNTLGRKSKKLLAAGTLEIVTKPDDVDGAMDAYDTVYASSWKQAEPYPTFVRNWARRCAEQGWLRLGVARVGGVPVAAQFWFTVGRRAYIFKLAYDDAQSKWSAGTVLTAHLMRHALDVDRVVEIDYLTGDDAYKQTWMSHRRERVGLMACNLRSAGGLVAAAAEAAGWARQRLFPRPAAAHA